MTYTNQFNVSNVRPIDISKKIGFWAGYHLNNNAIRLRDDKEKSIHFETNFNVDPCYIFETGFNNKFVGTYYECFVHHGNAVFSPSDIWLVICLNFSKYINQPSNEELIKKFIGDTKEKKTLTINRLDDLNLAYIEDSIDLIKENSFDKELIELLRCDFNCSNWVEKIACSIATMEATQKAFKHELVKYCGFNAIKLIGEKEDWIKLNDKINELKKYGYDKWNSYLSKINQIIDKFVESFEKPDLNFFAKMIHSWASFEGGFYDIRYDRITGWILDLFYEFKDEYLISEIPNIYSEIDADFIDIIAGTNEKIKIESGFYGIYVEAPDSEYNNSFRKYTSSSYPLYPSEWNSDVEYNSESSDDESNDKTFESDKEENQSEQEESSDNIHITNYISKIYDYRPIVYCQIKK